MPTRFAIMLGDDIRGVISQLTGNDAVSEVFGDDVYMVLTPLSNTEFNLQIMDQESMFEAFKNDSDLHILQF